MVTLPPMVDKVSEGNLPRIGKEKRFPIYRELDSDIPEGVTIIGTSLMPREIGSITVEGLDVEALYGSDADVMGEGYREWSFKGYLSSAQIQYSVWYREDSPKAKMFGQGREEREIEDIRFEGKIFYYPFNEPYQRYGVEVKRISVDRYLLKYKTGKRLWKQSSSYGYGHRYDETKPAEGMKIAQTQSLVKDGILQIVKRWLVITERQKDTEKHDKLYEKHLEVVRKEKKEEKERKDRVERWKRYVRIPLVSGIVGFVASLFLKD